MSCNIICHHLSNINYVVTVKCNHKVLTEMEYLKIVYTV